MWINSHNFLGPLGRNDALTVNKTYTKFWPIAPRTEAVPAVYQLDSTKQLRLYHSLARREHRDLANALDINIHWRL